jgi:hypothetical protein
MVENVLPLKHTSPAQPAREIKKFEHHISSWEEEEVDRKIEN